MSQPLVSIVTPVYNGEKYLAECIESVLAQSYENWEYIIMNNCSSDRTLEIAENYAHKDARIKIFSNNEVFPIMKNWNSALHQISPQSKYCKIVHADDWIFPQCVEKMVAVGEKSPSVTVISAYSLEGSRVIGDRLPFPSEFLPGHKICRWVLLGKVYPFSRPTSLLLRSDEIRKRKCFYNESKLNADIEILYEILRNSDFGFIHEILTFIRIHESSMTSTALAPDSAFLVGNLDLLIHFGPVFLSPEEYSVRLKQLWRTYYLFLAKNLFGLKGKDFWEHHNNSMKELGYKLSILRVLAVSLFEVLGSFRKTIRIFLAAVTDKFRKQTATTGI